MKFSEYLPKSNSGSNINGICLENALVERICLSYGKPKTLKFPINEKLVDWLFLVGIYKSKDEYYLLLDVNDHSSTIDSMFEDSLCLNTGFKLISESIAIELTEKISKLGKEYFTISIPCYYELMVSMVSLIECTVVFSPLLEMNGYFDRINKEIVVANNNSQFVMIWTLVHEYVHYLLNSKKDTPSTIEEYLCDDAEYLCDTIAFKLMKYFLGIDVITSIVESVLLKVKNACLDVSKFNSLKECDLESPFSPEEGCIMNYLMRANSEKNKEMQDTIDSICDRILNSFKAKFNNNSETCIDCAQTGLVKLSPIDNQSLYDMVINEISPMFPNEDC